MEEHTKEKDGSGATSNHRRTIDGHENNVQVFITASYDLRCSASNLSS